MKWRSLVKALLGLSTAVSLFSTVDNAQAAAFQVYEQSGAGTGDYHAGGAAEAMDASTIFYNPAGLMHLKHAQAVASVVGIPTYMKFHGTVTGPLGAQTGTAQGGGFTPGNNIAPGAYVSYPISDRWSAGFGFTAPFGLATDYPKDSVAAQYSTLTEMKVLDYTPAIAFRVDRFLSLGAGLDIDTIDATLNNYQFDTFPDKNEGHDTAYGWHAGLLWEFSPTTRVGLSYHSQVSFHLTGTSKLYDGSVPLIVNKGLSTSVTTPDYLLLSAYHDFSSRWTGLASVMYTGWHVFNKLTLNNVAGASVPVTINESYTNSWDLALGEHYTVNSKWLLKAGVGYDKTPIHGVYRNLRLPDQDHYALAFGTHYQPWQSLGLDLGYSHIFIPQANLNNTGDIAGTTVTTVGHMHSHANIFGAQLTYSFG